MNTKSEHGKEAPFETQDEDIGLTHQAVLIRIMAHQRRTEARESSNSQLDKDAGKFSRNTEKLASTPYWIPYILFTDIIDTRIGVITKLEAEVKGIKPMYPDMYYMQQSIHSIVLNLYSKVPISFRF